MNDTKVQFANILFSGSCNMHCRFCIGKLTREYKGNLNQFPIEGLDAFIRECRKRDIREISFTGTNTDPLLYKYIQKLISFLRQKIPGVRLSLHTNGLLVLKKKEIVELFDRLSVSIYSFDPDTYKTLTGITKMPDFSGIARTIQVPIKISVIYSYENQSQIHEIIKECRKVGIKRFVLRKISGFFGPDNPFTHLQEQRIFGGNPVYLIDGLEITWWDFQKSELSCLNLFADGSISEEYRLVN